MCKGADCLMSNSANNPSSQPQETTVSETKWQQLTGEESLKLKTWFLSGIEIPFTLPFSQAAATNFPAVPTCRASAVRCESGARLEETRDMLLIGESS